MAKLSDKKKLSTMEWSTRTDTCFKHHTKLHTVGDVRRTTDAELLRIPNFGRVSLKEVREQIPYEEQPQKPVRVNVGFVLQDIQQYQVTLNQKMSQTLEEMGKINVRHQLMAGDITKLDAAQAATGRDVRLLKSDIEKLQWGDENHWPKQEQFNQIAKAVNKIAAYANAMDAHKEELKRLTLNQITDLTSRIDALSGALDKLRAEQLHIEVRLKRLNSTVKVEPETEGSDAERQAETQD